MAALFYFIFIFLHYFTAHFVILKYENYTSKYFEFNALDLFYLGSNFTYTFMIFKSTYKLFLKEEYFAHELWKDHESSEIVLNNYKLACHSFMDTSRKLETSGSETQGLYYSGYIRQHEFNVFITPLESLSPQIPLRLCRASQVDMAHTLHHNWRSPSLGNYNLLKVLLAKLPKLWPRGRQYVFCFCQKVNLSSAPEANTMSVFQAELTWACH